MKQTTSLEKYLDDSHLYYNINIYNDSDKTQIAKFVETRTTPLLESCEDWHMSVIRFSIPTSTLPILYMIPLDSTGITNYSITLQYDTDSVTVPLVFESETVDNTYGVYSYRQLVDIINNAFQKAYSILVWSTLAPDYRSPFMIYDESSQTFKLYASKGYDNSLTGSDTINIWFNTKLYGLFQNFKAYNNTVNGQPNSDGMDYRIIVKNLGNNYIRGIIPPSTSQDLPPPNGSIPLYSATTTYSLNYVVYSGGIYYYSLVDANLNHTPALSPLFWEPFTISELGIPIPDNWLNSTAYVIGDVVYYSGQYYIANLNNSGKIPSSNPAEWFPAPYFEFIEMSQEYNSIYFLNSLQSVIFTTQNVPVSTEFQSSNLLLNTSAQNNALSILTDFEPAFTNAGESRSILQYLPTAEFRRIDLQSTTSLKIFDIQFYFRDKEQVLRQLTLGPGETLSVKILFEKKQKSQQFE